MKGIIFDIQCFSTHDGPGIRSVVFFKGCPLRCAWYENPESQEAEPELLFDPRHCIGCGSCLWPEAGAIMGRDEKGRIAASAGDPAPKPKWPFWQKTALSWRSVPRATGPLRRMT